MFYKGLQVVDEDGIECFSSRFEFMCTVAQAAGFDYADLGDLEILAPRSLKPSSASSDQRWDRFKRFAVLRSDQAFRSLLMRWARRDSKLKRIQELRSRAFEDLLQKLTQKSESIKQRYKNAVVGANGIWHLALNDENEEALLEMGVLEVILRLLEDYAVNDEMVVEDNAGPSTLGGRDRNMLGARVFKESRPTCPKYVSASLVRSGQSSAQKTSANHSLQSCTR